MGAVLIVPLQITPRFQALSVLLSKTRTRSDFFSSLLALAPRESRALSSISSSLKTLRMRHSPTCGNPWILYNRCSSTKAVSIFEGPLAALYHPRLKNETRMLWIDAICINQQNTNERSHAVAQMGNIYNKSLKCHCVAGGFGSGQCSDVSSPLRSRSMDRTCPTVEWSRKDNGNEKQAKCYLFPPNSRSLEATLDYPGVFNS